VTLADLREHQRSSAASYLFALHECCRRRFRNAALLVGADTARWPGLDGLEKNPSYDLRPLLSFWTEVVERYNAELFDPQIDLFRGPEAQLDRFSQFIHWRLWPVLAKENEVVRNVLRAAGSLPSKNRSRATSALVACITDLPFDLNCRIDPEDAE